MKIVIIGGGPGGYVAAIRAAQLGGKVTLIEDKAIGGTCLNTGCIPTKVLLQSTDLYDLLKNESQELGLKLSGIEFDWEKIQERKELVVTQLVEGVKVLLESNKIKILMGKGKFLSKNKIEVTLRNGNKEIVDFQKAIVASGSISSIIPIPGKDLEGVITSTEALKLQKIPKSITIIGGGVIGVEFANIFSNLGSKVTIIEMLPRLLANMDNEIVEHLENTLESKDIKIYKNTGVTAIEKLDKDLKVKTSKSDEIISEIVLMATGRVPNTKGLGIENIGIKTINNAIKVDKLFKTNLDNIYAIGDCTGEIQLAHVASANGTMAAEIIMGKAKPIDFRTIPYCVYTKPEIASVGLTEEAAMEKGYSIKTGRFPLYANGKSIILGDVNGLVKFIVNKSNDEIIGLHIAGNNATELIGIGALAIRLEATVDEVLTTIHAHPTVGEAIYEAAGDVFDKAIHLPVG